MKEFFKDILDIEDVEGLMLFTFKGELIFEDFPVPPAGDPASEEWWPLFIGTISGVREADLVFERKRVYVRKADVGYLLVFMDLYASISMLRLNCDMLLPELTNFIARAKGRKSLFKKKK